MYQCSYYIYNDTLRNGTPDKCWSRVYSEPLTVNALPHSDVWRFPLCSTQYPEYSVNALLSAVERTTTAATDDAVHSAVLSPPLKMLCICHMVIALANISPVMATTNSCLSKILHMTVQLCHMKTHTKTQSGNFPAITPPVCGVREGLRLDVRLVFPCHACFFLLRTRGA